jgi:hypothetical protein
VFRFAGKVEYTDGTIEEFEAGNVAVAAWERYAVRHKLPMGKDAPPTLSSIVIAHHALGISEGVDAWAETLVSIELAEKEPEAVPPTPAEASIV